MNLIPILKTFLKRSGRFIVRKSPTILTALSAGGTVTAVIFAVKDTPKAERLIQKRKEELNVDRLPPVEVFKACWPVYIPTAGMTLASIACGIGANSIHLKRQAALVGLYTTTEHTLREYREHVVEAIGKEAEEDIHAKAVEKAANKQYEEKETRVISTGDELFFDDYAKRFFRSDIHQVRNWILNIRENMLTGPQMYISANEAYEMLDQECPEYAIDKGWTIDDQFNVGTKEARLDSGERYTIIWFTTPPHDNYYKSW